MCTFVLFFFFNDTATTEIYTLSLHDALPICQLPQRFLQQGTRAQREGPTATHVQIGQHPARADRKSTRLNSSHSQISYAVFCLKKKKKDNKTSVASYRTYQRRRTSKDRRNTT